MAARRGALQMAVLAVPALFVLQAPPAIDPAPVLSGPIVTSSLAEVEPNGRTVLTIDGFVSPYVTISICGNEARRGSADCNMSASEGVEVYDDRPLVIDMPVAPPPTDCPCVIRVVGKDVTEVALTPLVVTGHPVGPLVDPPVFGDLVQVSISAKEAHGGALEALRSDLGGRTTYEVTMRVKNLATTPLKQVGISASAGRSESDDSLVSIDVADPGLLGVGQTWQQIVTVEIPAPAFGSTEWRAVVSGAGPSVTAISVTKHRPWLLIITGTVLLANVWLLFVRWRVRRRNAREAEAGDPAEIGGIGPGADGVTGAAATVRDGELVAAR